MDEYQFDIENFTYNGFAGQSLEGLAPYKAKFNRWTNDPGIAVFDCSDGEERLIPTFAVMGEMPDSTPKQTYEGGKQYFGIPSHS